MGYSVQYFIRGFRSRVSKVAAGLSAAPFFFHRERESLCLLNATRVYVAARLERQPSRPAQTQTMYSPGPGPSLFMAAASDPGPLNRSARVKATTAAVRRSEIACFRRPPAFM